MPDRLTPAIQIGQPATILRPDFNRRRTHIIVYEFRPDTPESRIPRVPGGSPGTYKVKFILGTPGKDEFFSNINMDITNWSGHSPLLAPVPTGGALRLDLMGGTESASMLFGANDAHELSYAETTLRATSFQEAHKTAYNLIMPQLRARSTIT